MFKITKIRLTGSDGVTKTRHCDILTDNLEQKRSELRRQYEKECGRKIQIHLTYRDGDSDELMNEGEE